MPVNKATKPARATYLGLAIGAMPMRLPASMAAVAESAATTR